MDEQRLRHILAEELEKVGDLPANSAEHIAQIRTGNLSPGLRAAVAAMRRAIDESKQ